MFSGFGKSSTHENLRNLRDAKTDNAKIDAYFSVITSYFKSHPDSSQFYIDEVDLYLKRNNIDLKENQESKLYFFEGIVFYKKGFYNQAITKIEISITYLHPDSLTGKRHFYLGLCNKLLGNYSFATENFIKCIKIFEKNNDEKSLVNVYINLGNVFRNIKEYPKALDYFKKALELAEKSNNESLNRLIYNNMGNVFLDMEDYELALFQFTASYQDAVKTKSKKGQFFTLINMANAKAKLYKSAEALEHYTLALRLADTLNTPSYKEKIFYELGNFFAEMKNVPQAELYLGKALQIADKLKHYPDLKRIYQAYKNLYRDVGNYKNSLHYYAKYEEIKDSVIAQENQLNITKLYSLFEFEKKTESLERDREIEIEKNKTQAAELTAQKVKSERDSIFIYLLIGIGILLLVLAAALGLLSTTKQKKNNELKESNTALAESQEKVKSQNSALEKVNNDLESINHELLNKNSEIESQKEELQSQRDLLNLTNLQLKVRNKDVTDSIHYAQKIQQAMLNSSFHIEESGIDHFTFYKPRDIVSGDFYWSNQVGDELIIAIGDCTGHGVPGAFMSCLGISLLNEIVFGRKVKKPHSMLEELRNSVIQLIATDRSADLQIGDGMDIAIMVINMKTRNMKFSGAMNSVKIISKGELIELKGDKSPIGQHIIPNHTFTMQEHQLFEGDNLYMSTDGFKDQFGGPKGKKLGKRRLNENLVRISEFSIPVQYTEVISLYKNWRKFEEQIDDVCLFGMKMK